MGLNNYSCSDKLLGFCGDRISQNNTFSIPPLYVLEVGIAISKIDNKKSTGCDGISVKLLKIALPCIVRTPTLMNNLCIQKNIFPAIFKRVKIIPVPKTKTISSDLNDCHPITVLPVLTKPQEKTFINT